MKLKLTAFTSVVIFTALVAGALAQQRPADYPQWRGQNRDGAVAAFTAPASWPEQLTRKWKVDIGLGYATPLLVANRLYLFSRQGENEMMTAMDPESGKVLCDPTGLVHHELRRGPTHGRTEVDAGLRRRQALLDWHDRHRDGVRRGDRQAALWQPGSTNADYTRTPFLRSSIAAWSSSTWAGTTWARSPHST